MRASGKSPVVRSCTRASKVAVVCISAIAFALIGSQTIAAPTIPIGATPGSFTVDANGGANYSIPIAIPPGTAGMVPSLSFTYSTSIDSGILGKGWSISGLSVIQRCGRNFALDGAKGGVSYDDNDRFCLDGQRLVAINGGTYGANNTEYRTERESFNRIISYRDANFTGKGPQKFLVTTSSGQKLEYGVSLDSRIEAQGRSDGTVRLWALNKVQDLNGNYYTFSYDEDTANGEYHPTRVDYTGNNSPSLTPYNSVQFIFDPNPKVVPRYEAGSIIKTTQRLAKVEIYAGASKVREYRLSYDTTNSIGASRLTTLQECGFDGVCLPETRFGWVNETLTITDRGRWAQGKYGKYVDAPDLFRNMDVNGDGLQDIVIGPIEGTWSAMLSNGSGFDDPITLIAESPYNPSIAESADLEQEFQKFRGPITVSDVNGDGKQDIVIGPTINGDYFLLRSTGTSFVDAGALITNAYKWVGGTTKRPMDVNGDGLQDVVIGPTTNGDYYVLQSNGTSLIDKGKWISNAYKLLGEAPKQSMDANGDGLQDIVIGPTTGGDYFVLQSTGSSFVDKGKWVSSAYAPMTESPRTIMDVNGDGLQDIVVGPSGSKSSYYVVQNTGSSFIKSGQWIEYGYSILNAPRYPVDVNSDGIQDILIGPNAGYWNALQSTGTSLIRTETWSSFTYKYLEATKRIIDVTGDGIPDIVFGPTAGGDWFVLQVGQGGADRLATVTTGMGHVTRITYKPLTDKTLYTKDDNAVAPYVDVQPPTYVVSRYTVSDGLGGEAGVSYKYAGAKSHRTGGGWLGFREIQVSDEQKGTKTVTTYDQRFENGTFGAKNLVQNYIDNVIISQTENFYSAQQYTSGDYVGKQKFLQLDDSLTQRFDLNGNALSCTSVHSVFDSLGFATNISTMVDTSCAFQNAFTKTVTSFPNHDTTNWRLGRIARTQIVNAAPGVAPTTRTLAYAYDANGLMTSDTIEPLSNSVEPDSSKQGIKSTYAYDSFGNLTKVTKSGSNFISRDTLIAGFDGRGQFPVVSTNALGHNETRVFDSKWGVATSHTGPNGLTTTTDYDGIGRPITLTDADGKSITTTLALCDGSDPDCPTLAKLRVTTTITSSGTSIPPSIVFKDLLGRTLRAKGQAFDGRTIFQDTEYDNLGHVTRSSVPYFSGSSPNQWTQYTYDTMDRVLTVTAPDNTITSTVYNGMTTSVTNALNQTNSATKNAVEQVVESNDALGGKTQYFYDAVGNLLKVIDAVGNTVLTAQYDVRGRKVQLFDLDAGSRTFGYNALGELLTETDAKGQVATVTYDLLSRIKTRTNLEGTYTWTYDTAALGTSGLPAKGRVTSITGPNYASTPSYDSFGRQIAVTETINGESFTMSTAFDAQGRPDTMTYPTGFKAKNVYDAESRLIEVRDGSSNALYWKANAYDVFGKLLSHSLGNGLTTDLTYDPLTQVLKSVRTGTGGIVQNLDYGFDPVGNLISRSDNNQPYSESFGYDGLNRLTSVSGPQPKSYSYNSIGNITTKSDVGNYTYHATKVHAVVGTTGTLNNTYAYDENGNMITGAGRSLSYTSFNKPQSITANGITTSFTYGPGFGRLTKSNAQGTTVYIGKLYERLTQGTAVTHRHYVASPAGLVAVVSQGATSTTRYMHGDHLGSTSAITDENGIVVERLSFDPFGARRQPSGLNPVQPITSSVNRGFTGHEHDGESGLINMNARIYDPVLGRFMQPDVIADGMGGQGLNRYSYVHNNPLSATDPSGNKSKTLEKLLKYGPLFPIVAPLVLQSLSPDKLIATGTAHYNNVTYIEPWMLEHPKSIPVVKAIINIVVTYFGGSMLVPAINGIYDARFTYLMGGDMDDAWHAFNRAYISSGVTFAVSTYFPVTSYASWDSIAVTVTVRGISGGVSAEIQGGDFSQGFAMGAGFTALDFAFRGIAKGSAMSKQNSDVDVTGFKTKSDPYSCRIIPAGEEGGSIGKFVNKWIFGVRATAWVHDRMTGTSPVGYDAVSIWGVADKLIPRDVSNQLLVDIFNVPIIGHYFLNWAAMVPSAAITLGAIANETGASNAWLNTRFTDY